MEKEKKSVYYCTNLRKLGWLKQHGFEPLDCVIDQNDPNRWIWVFERSRELMECLGALYATMPILLKQEG